ncbi:MAG: TIGR00645 family protein [Deltaproteobacteria bacterium]|nr:TIGR00645 family protein [Deltaproteobacteria bacterium]
MKRIENAVEQVIFASRWIQVPLYVGLIGASILYAYKFLVEFAHLVVETPEISEEHLMLGILTLVDITMVLNLLVMVIIGGYATFVSHIDIEGHEDHPDWLDKIDAGTMKVKLATALVSISGIHLLKGFINIANTDPEHLKWQLAIHGMFLVSAILLAYTEVVLKKSHAH